jgi:hypothetical protein
LFPYFPPDLTEFREKWTVWTVNQEANSLSQSKPMRITKLSPLRCSNCTKQIDLTKPFTSTTCELCGNVGGPFGDLRHSPNSIRRRTRSDGTLNSQVVPMLNTGLTRQKCPNGRVADQSTMKLDLPRGYLQGNRFLAAIFDAEIPSEPTTCRLTARILPCSAVLAVAIYCLISVTCRRSF